MESRFVPGTDAASNRWKAIWRGLDSNVLVEPDSEGLYSVTEHPLARSQARLIATCVKSGYHKGSDITRLNVVDATACLGGNTFGFMMEGFGKVVSVELNEARYDKLKLNISQLLRKYRQKVRIQKVKITQMDCLKYLEILSRHADQDDCKSESIDSSDSDIDRPHILFFDPPWGGVEVDTYNPNINGLEMHQVLAWCLRRKVCSHMICFKLPRDHLIKQEIDNMKRETKSLVDTSALAFVHFEYRNQNILCCLINRPHFKSLASGLDKETKDTRFHVDSKLSSVVVYQGDSMKRLRLSGVGKAWNKRRRNWRGDHVLSENRNVTNVKSWRNSGSRSNTPAYDRFKT